MNTFARYMNALAIWVLAFVLLAAYFVEYYYEETPCPLCLLQRLGMIGIASGLMLNIRFGIKTHYYGVSFLSAILGASVSIRQIMLHICPGMPIFGIPVFGLSLYTWAFIVFVCVIVGLSILLFFYRPLEEFQAVRKMGFFSLSACIIMCLITLANIFSTLNICGLGFCIDS